jgi:hypothetical protein
MCEAGQKHGVLPYEKHIVFSDISLLFIFDRRFFAGGLFAGFFRLL